ncbi:MAG: CvpA family protein [Tissierellia bacterium]|nr:CvpA family protein [Tissierellia bacterium]
MNWLDMVIIIILLYNIVRGLREGFIFSVFNIIGFIISIYIASKYYLSIYYFITDSPVLNGLFVSITEIILSAIFPSRSEITPNFIPGIIRDGIVDIIVMLLSAIFVFLLVNAVVKILLSLLHSIFKVPVLSGLDKIGGVIFGLIKGFLIIYFLKVIITPIALFFPESFIGKGLYDSLFLVYFGDLDLILDFLPIKSHI